jgi:hypothetical protein
MNANEIIILIKINLILYVTYAIITNFKTAMPWLYHLITLIEIFFNVFFVRQNFKVILQNMIFLSKVFNLLILFYLYIYVIYNKITMKLVY